jgi:hypothetical protein
MWLCAQQSDCCVVALLESIPRLRAPRAWGLFSSKCCLDSLDFARAGARAKSRLSLEFVNRHNMAAPFQDAELDPLWEFCCSWNSPERKFITPDLEGAREALLQKAREYQVMIATETFAVDTPGWRSVPSEWEEDQPQRFARAIEALHRLAGEIVDLHANFIHVGRRHLIGTRA